MFSKAKGPVQVVLIFVLLALLVVAFAASCKGTGGTPSPEPAVPSVLSTTPEDAAASVLPTITSIVAVFSVEMDGDTINEDTFMLLGPSETMVAGTVTASDATTATFTPALPLAASTTYTAKITTGVKSAEGLALAEEKSWSFTTGTVSVLAAASSTTCATKSDGLLYCWGENDKGQVGDDTVIDKSFPTKVSGSYTDWVALSGARVGKHFCGIRAGGTLWCWGDNEKGQLGLNASGATEKKTKPTQVGSDADWSMVACGTGHTCAIKTSGKLYCWGDNTAGQLGDATKDARLVPWQIGTATDWKAVGLGLAHTCAAKGANYEAYCWGDNSSGQLGIDSKDEKTSPEKLASLSGVVALGAGWVHTCALKSNDDIYCWGGNAAGQLGGGTDVAESLVPAIVHGGGNWTTFSSNLGHNCGVQSDEVLYCWGYNEWGQLGVGEKTNKNKPTRVSPEASWMLAETGAGHSCARKTDGDLYCWGDNAKGQLGDGMTTESLSPKNITGFK